MSDLPLAYSPDPVEGWRANNVVVDATGREAWLTGVHHRRLYRADANAACSVFDHPAPADDCHCGLHCWPAREQAERYRRAWAQDALCRVELVGEVICHGEADGEIEGYRGSHMRTLAVEFAPDCVRCGRPATAFGAIDVELDGEWLQVRPVCDRCPARLRLPPADLTAALGTEVRFGEAQATRGLRRRFDSLRVMGSPFAPLLASATLFAVLGVVTAGHRISDASWVEASLWGAVTLACLGAVLVLALRLGRHAALWGVSIVVAAGLVTVPMFAASRAVVPPARPLRPVAPLHTRLPADPDALRSALTARGARDVAMADLDPTRRAVSFLEATGRFGDPSRCVQLALLAQPDGSYAVSARDRAAVEPGGRCAVAFPMPRESSRVPSASVPEPSPVGPPPPSS